MMLVGGEFVILIYSELSVSEGASIFRGMCFMLQAIRVMCA